MNQPEPPDDLGASGRQAWYRGFAEAMGLVSGAASDMASGAAEEAKDDDRCDECGSALVVGFGGKECVNCK